MANIIMPKTWSLPESEITPEHVFLNRRAFIQRLSGGAIAASALGAAGVFNGASGALAAVDGAIQADRNVAYGDPKPWTPEDVATTYNNFYEFGSHKQISRAAQALKLNPWRIEIDGEVENPLSIEAEDLIAKMPLEERVYRFRCVEAWAMVVPWTGFPFRALMDMASPTSAAKYVRMETFYDPDVASGQKQRWYPWPYVEGLTMAEATNDLTFMVTGAYGKPLPKQMGAPVRLMAPWKYGFKNIKSLVRISFTSERPVSFWEELAANEYGFWANVNPKVSHPRWSQAMERDVATGESRKTLMWNGYGEWVAGLYPTDAGPEYFR